MNRLLRISVCLPIFMLASAQVQAQDLLRISRVVMAQQVDSGPAAVYPEDAKTAGIEGTVTLDVVISSKGVVEQVHVMSGPDKLREPAKQAVSRWTYKPYLIDDVAREVETTVLVAFSLKDGGTSRNASGDLVETVTDASVAPPASVPQPGARPVGPVRVSPGTVAGLVLHREYPVYPDQARAAHLNGTVVLRVIISKSGTIESITILSGDGRLQQAAVDAIKKWKFKPFLTGGRPAEVDTQIAFGFETYGPKPSQSTIENPNPFGSDGFGPH